MERKNLIIAQAAEILNMSEFSVLLESPPNHPSFIDETKSIDEAAQSLAETIREGRDAWASFFKSHPELNP